MKKIFLFYLDGSLVPSGGDGSRALDKPLPTLFHLEKAMSHIHPSGKPDPAIFREMAQTLLHRDLTMAEFEALTASYLHYLEHEMATTTKKSPLPGVLKFLD